MTESLLRLMRDARRARRGGPAAIAQRQRERLADMVAFARAHSPYYRSLYQDLPDQVSDPRLLPTTSKKPLMADFDDWTTDPAATLAAARAFIDRPEMLGERFLGKYVAVTTSGTTGTPGIFLIDDRTLTVVNAMALRSLGAWLSPLDVLKIAARGGRMSLLMATGGHFASAAAAARLRKASRWRAKRLQALSVQAPLSELVAALNRFQPAILAPYASLAPMLADEQQAGRLHIHPVLLTLAAEGLPTAEYQRIADVFNAKVGNSWAASECLFLSYNCEQQWLHVDADWVIVEPVDADHQPTPPGETSHTVLISNLANRIQPILRYDLGDSVLQRHDPCPCGNPLPAVRVQGRASEVLTFPTPSGAKVTIPPLAFGLLGEQPAIEQFQIVQTRPASLRVRLRTNPGADPEQAWQKVHADITHLLNQHQLSHVTVERDTQPPQQTAGGKYRTIIPLT